MDSVNTANKLIPVESKGEPKTNESKGTTNKVQKQEMNEVHKKKSSSTSWKGSISDPNSAGILYVAIQKGAQAISSAWNTPNITSHLSMANIGSVLSNLIGKSERIHLEAVVYTSKTISSKDSQSPIQSGLIQQGNSYNGSVKKECDACHLDTERGYSFVMDGSGHGDEKMGKAMRLLKKDCIEIYNSGFDEIGGNKKFSSTDEAKEFMAKQVKKIAEQIAKNESGQFIQISNDETGHTANVQPPTFTLSQIFEINGKSYLVTAEIGDSPAAILRQPKDGNPRQVILTKEEYEPGKISYANFGLIGNSPDISKKLENGTVSKVKYSAHELEEGDQVVICSDGYTDFTKKSDFEEIVFAKDPMVKYNECINGKNNRGEKDFNGFPITRVHNEKSESTGEVADSNIDDLAMVSFKPKVLPSL